MIVIFGAKTNLVDVGDSSRIPILEPLRGFAALSVCVFHFSNGNTDYLQSTDVVERVGSYGWLGVEMFFVISGFVLPWSLWASSYNFSHYGRFVARRMIRLDPPYFVCMLLVVGLQFLSSIAPGYQGKPFSVSLPMVAAHFAYMNGFVGFEWLNPVFWTLAIEFQFYLLIGLLFPFSKFRIGRYLLIPICCMAIVFPSKVVVFHYLPLFGLGFVCFLVLSQQFAWWKTLSALAGVCTIAVQVNGWMQALVGVGTAMVIIAMERKPFPRFLTPFAALGALSYSLYLVHVPVGGRVINLFSRLPENVLLRYLGIALALVFSIAASVLFYRFIESPSHRLARTIQRHG